MASNPNRTHTTQHTCGGPVFGRKTPGCPRCDELIAGAAPILWSITRRAEADRQHASSIREHFSSPRHRSGGCGAVCTFGEW